MPFAEHFCVGEGYDIGAGPDPFPGARPIDILIDDESAGMAPTAERLPKGFVDYIFSSHCLEHLVDPVTALEHWRSRLRPGGCLFLYLPHPEMTYWRPEHNRKHLHTWTPEQIVRILHVLGFVCVLHSGRDLYWSFAVVGFVPESKEPIEETGD